MLSADERLQKIRPLSWDQRDAVLTTAAKRDHALFAVLLKAGLRPGEAFALQPGDLDLKGLTVHVERAVTTGGRIKSTKTHETRDVDLTPDLALTLRRYLTSLRAERLERGRGEPEWLFTRADGALMDKGTARRVFQAILKLAGLPAFRVYDCRHTYATMSLAAGVSLFSLSRRMGTSVKMIDRTYGHLAPDAEEQERLLLDAYDSRERAVEAIGR